MINISKKRKIPIKTIINKKTPSEDEVSIGGGRGSRTLVLHILIIKDYTLRTLFELTIRNCTIPLFLKWFGLLRTNPPLVSFRVETTPLYGLLFLGYMSTDPKVSPNLIRLLPQRLHG